MSSPILRLREHTSCIVQCYNSSEADKNVTYIATTSTIYKVTHALGKVQRTTVSLKVLR